MKPTMPHANRDEAAAKVVTRFTLLTLPLTARNAGRCVSLVSRKVINRMKGAKVCSALFPNLPVVAQLFRFGSLLEVRACEILESFNQTKGHECKGYP